jgi:hypothetical protein
MATASTDYAQPISYTEVDNCILSLGSCQAVLGFRIQKARRLKASEAGNYDKSSKLAIAVSSTLRNLLARDAEVQTNTW